jgi:flagellar export protein FliJ
MKSLKTLVRARQSALDEKRQALNLLEDQADAVLSARAHLAEEQRKEAEMVAGCTDAGFGYGTYLKAARRRDAALRRDLDALAERLEAARSEVADAFAEIKRFELIEAAQIEQARKEAARREQEELDELGLTVFRRGEAERA